MLDQATQALKTVSRRMLDSLARKLHDNPTEATAEEVINSFTKPWAEVFAYTRLAALADGMVDQWDDLQFDLTEPEQEELILQAQQMRDKPYEQIVDLFDDFDSQEQLLIRPWFGLPPPIPPSNLAISGDSEEFNVRLPSYEVALKALAERHLVTREEWDQLEDEETAQAFTVAGLQTEAALARVRDALSNTLQEGWTLEEFKDVAGRQSFLSEAHAETVFRTNLHQAYSDGKMALLEHPLVSDAFPYATYDSIHDDRVRPTHKVLDKSGLNGTNVYRIDDPVFQAFRPPWDFSCFLPGTPIEGRFEVGIRSWYDGKTVEITTRSGKRLTITINHPILTSDGFVAAGQLRKGDNVISYKSRREVIDNSPGFRELSTFVSGPNQARFTSPRKNKYHAPATVEQVFRSLGNFGLKNRVPVRPNDLYGDAQFGEGHVDVVGATRELLLYPEAFGSQQSSHRDFASMDLGLVSVAGASKFNAHVNWSNSPLVRPPGGTKLSFDCCAILFDERPLRQLRFGAASNLDASRFETSEDGASINPGFASNLLERGPGEVFVDEIVQVRNLYFVGHVYDFQTEGGWILGSGIFCSNCRCGWGAITIRQAARKGVSEAEAWLESGTPPEVPESVPWPTYQGQLLLPNPAFRRT